MDRLTQKDTVAGMEYFDLKRDIPQIRAIDMLGQYEDTGLTPEQIKQLKAENAKLKAKFDEAMELIEILKPKIPTTGCEQCANCINEKSNPLHVCFSPERDTCASFKWQHQDRYEKLKESELNV